jgi:O-antigen ligase
MLRRFATLLAMPRDHPQAWPIAAFLGTVVLCLWLSVALDTWWPLALPPALVLAFITTVDLPRIFLLLLACLPLSVEFYLPGGLGTDLPSEPLMWVLTLAGTLWFLVNWRSLDGRFLRHPLTLALLAHLSWTFVCMVTAQDFLVALKFAVAKIWYVVVFYFLAGHFFSEEKRFRQLLWWFYLPLLFTVVVVLTRHAAEGFTFDGVNYVMGPFYRNHVMYACLLAIFLPFVWYGAYWYRRWSGRWWLLVAGIAIFLVGINFAYTRAAYVALAAAVVAVWVIRLRLLAVGLAAFVVAFGLFVSFVRSGDNWLEFAPDYERTVMHKRFENLLEATTKLEDISTMERVYRWVAATYMIRERPLTGFGPGNFYFYYKNYTVSSFRTYVSHNPERSGIHNYYLMVTVEQGWPGLAFFLLFCLAVMLKGERVYHQTQVPWRRRMAAAALLCFILIEILMLMNDFVETDKIGSFFFMTVAMLVSIDLANKDGDGTR